MPHETIASSQLVRRIVDKQAAHRLRAEHVDPLLAKVLATRGIDSQADIAYPPNQLPHLSAGTAMTAARLLARAIATRKNIYVIGDYGTDGICATAFAVLALRSIGISAQWLVGNRKLTRRSLDPSLIARAVADGAKLVVVADCNGDLQAGLAQARKHKLRVIVVSHHALAGNLGQLNADAVINPLQAGSGLNTTELCSSAVMFMLFRQAYRLIGTRRRLNQWLDLVAIATAADARSMAEICNRSIVTYGTYLIRCGRCRNIFKELLQERRTHCNLSELRHCVVPILSSTHLHADPHIGVSALLADKVSNARALAAELQLVHRRFANFTAKLGQQEAVRPDIAITLHRPQWDHSHAEIVVAALVEQFNVPAFVVCGKKPGCIGIARGTPHITVMHIFGEMAAKQPQQCGAWHGDRHEGRIRIRTNPQACCRLFAQLCRTQLQAALASIQIDADLTRVQLNTAQRQALLDIPWGKDFPIPLFSARVKIMRNLTSTDGPGEYIYLLKLGRQLLTARCALPLGARDSNADIVFCLQKKSHPSFPYDLHVVKVISAF